MSSWVIWEPYTIKIESAGRCGGYICGVVSTYLLLHNLQQVASHRTHGVRLVNVRGNTEGALQWGGVAFRGQEAIGVAFMAQDIDTVFETTIVQAHQACITIPYES